MPVIGTQQSPIRIVRDNTIKAKLSPLQFAYAKELPGHFKGDNFEFTILRKSNGHEITRGKELVIGGVTWVIRKIHIHSPAEHVFDEEAPADLECHLLHSRVGDEKCRGEKLVVAVFFKIVTKASAKSLLRPTLTGLNVAMGEAGKKDAEEPCDVAHPHDIDVKDFLPDRDHDSFYRYEGSLTSEPFSEDVNWYILKEKSEVFDKNIDEILKCAEQEARPVYALDRRFVLRNF